MCHGVCCITLHHKHRSQWCGTLCTVQSCIVDDGQLFGVQPLHAQTDTCLRSGSSHSHCTSDITPSCSVQHSPRHGPLLSHHAAVEGTLRSMTYQNCMTTTDDVSWTPPSPRGTASVEGLLGSEKNSIQRDMQQVNTTRIKYPILVYTAWHFTMIDSFAWN